MPTSAHEYGMGLIRGTAALDSGSGSWVSWNCPEMGIEEIASPDPLAHLMLQLAARVLADVSRDQRQHVGVFLGTAAGCLAADAEFDASRREADGRYASPAAFARTLPSTIASELSVKLGIGGPALTVCAGGQSTAVALARAACWLRHLEPDAMPYCLAGGFELRGRAPRGAIVLMGPTGERAHREITSPESLQELSMAEDESLDQLIGWIQLRRGSSA